MAHVLLHEAAGSLTAREGGKWAVTLITPGKGSSGTYSEAVLQRDAATAFPKGMKLWFKHPGDGQGAGDRDPRDQWGVLDENAEYIPGEGITGKVRLLPHWKDVVESLGDQASLSIYAMGDADNEGNVTALHESVTNSVDIVSYPGREGSGLKQKLEAARAASPKPGSTSAPDTHTQEESTMDELTKAVEALTTLLTGFVQEQKDAADKQRQAEADAEAEGKDVTEAVEKAISSVEAVKAASLLPSLEKSLIEAAKRGEDISAGLDAAKGLMTEAAAAQKPAGPQSYVHEATKGPDQHDYTISRLIGVN